MADFDRTNRPHERVPSHGPPGSHPADPATGVRPEARRGSGRLPWLVVGGIVAAAAVVATLQRSPGEAMDATGNGPRTVQTSGGDVQGTTPGNPPGGVQSGGQPDAGIAPAGGVATGVNGRTTDEPLEPTGTQRIGLDRIFNEEVARFATFVESARFASTQEVAQGLRLMANALRNYDVGSTGRTNNRGVAINLATQAELLESGRVSGGQEGTVLRNVMTQFSTTLRGVQSLGDGNAQAAAQAYTEAAERIRPDTPIAEQRDAVRRTFASASALFRAMGSEGQ